MSDDDGNRSFILKQKACKKAGCDNRVGRQHDYCPLHRE